MLLPSIVLSLTSWSQKDSNPVLTIKGGQVKVLIHASNVKISSLNMDDNYRKNKLGNKEQINKSGKQGNRKAEKE